MSAVPHAGSGMLVAMRPAVRTRAGRALVAGVLVLLGGTTTACSTGLPPTLGPSGVDGLTIPTPSPDPADFVAGVDNPWFPLAQGTTWTYRVYDAAGRATERVTVLPGTTAVDGVAATTLRATTTLPGGRVLGTVDRWYAQDRAGNVWWLGQRVSGRAEGLRSWRAGLRGARAGLAMAATPRLGDGYVETDAPGALRLDAEVLTVNGERSGPRGSYDHLVVVAVGTPGLRATTREFYARGIGLVSSSSVAPDITERDLVAVTHQ